MWCAGKAGVTGSEAGLVDSAPRPAAAAAARSCTSGRSVHRRGKAARCLPGPRGQPPRHAGQYACAAQPFYLRIRPGFKRALVILALGGGSGQLMGGGGTNRGRGGASLLVPHSLPPTQPSKPGGNSSPSFHGLQWPCPAVKRATHFAIERKRDVRVAPESRARDPVHPLHPPHARTSVLECSRLLRVLRRLGTSGLRAKTGCSVPRRLRYRPRAECSDTALSGGELIVGVSRAHSRGALCGCRSTCAPRIPPSGVASSSSARRAKHVPQI